MTDPDRLDQPGPLNQPDQLDQPNQPDHPAPLDEPLFNPFAPGYTDNPYPSYRQLRAEEPVHEHPFGFWVLSRHADVSALLRSANSVDYRNSAEDSAARLQADAMIDAADSAAADTLDAYGLSMLDRDPPDHTRLRGLVSKVFTPRSVAALEPFATELVDACLDRLADAGTADLIETVAFPVPFAVISRMLGIPETDHARIRELSGLLVRTLEPIGDPDLPIASPTPERLCRKPKRSRARCWRR